MMQKPEDRAENPSKVATASSKTPARPNESGTFYLEDHIKIYDPETKEVHLETRG